MLNFVKPKFYIYTIYNLLLLQRLNPDLKVILKELNLKEQELLEWVLIQMFRIVSSFKKDRLKSAPIILG